MLIELYQFRVRTYDEVLKNYVYQNLEVELPICSPNEAVHFVEHKNNYIFAFGKAYLSASQKKPVKVLLDSFSLLEKE